MNADESPVPRASLPEKRVSTRELSRVIALASQMHIQAVAEGRASESHATSEVLDMGRELEIPEEFLQAALREVQGTPPSVCLHGGLAEVKDRVVKQLLAQSPTGTRLERVGPNEVLVHTEQTQGAPYDSLRLRFFELPEGRVEVDWEVDTSRKERYVTGLMGGTSAFLMAMSVFITLTAGLATAGGPALVSLLTAVGLLFLASATNSKLRQSGQGSIANSLKSVRELEEFSAGGHETGDENEESDDGS